MSSIVLKPINPNDVPAPAAGYKTVFLNIEDGGLLYYKDDYGNIIKLTNLEENLYVHNQTEASATWIINHTLNTYPNVTVVDSAGTKVIGDEKYVDQNTIELTFSAPFSGKAYLTWNKQ
jgi:hypothetical protein